MHNQDDTVRLSNIRPEEVTVYRMHPIKTRDLNISDQESEAQINERANVSRQRRILIVDDEGFN